MHNFNLNSLTLRALKIIRKGYRKNRLDQKARERLALINILIAKKERMLMTPKR